VRSNAVFYPFIVKPTGLAGQTAAQQSQLICLPIECVAYLAFTVD
jgi:hypothetical protein